MTNKQSGGERKPLTADDALCQAMLGTSCQIAPYPYPLPYPVKDLDLSGIIDKK